jgi:hypothetical protein
MIEENSESSVVSKSITFAFSTTFKKSGTAKSPPYKYVRCRTALQKEDTPHTHQANSKIQNAKIL